MDRELEEVAGDYHGVLWFLHAAIVAVLIILSVLHGFASFFFGRRIVRDYNRWKPVRRLIFWLFFHLIAAIVSFVASRLHARDARWD